MGIGLYFSKRATGSLTEYFVAGRKMTWWLAGTSIVATSFAADTPLVIAGWMRTVGLERNWFWWGGIMGMMLCTFFFARLWRRSNLITDVEFNELRYGGRPAAGLRIFHASYRSLIQNTLVMGWVTLAMTKIIDVTLDIPTLVFLKGQLVPTLVVKGAELSTYIDMATVMHWPIIGEAIIPAKATGIIVCLSVAAFYSAISGLWGVVATDLFQFTFAMTGTVILMVIVLVVAKGPVNMVDQARTAVREGRIINKMPFPRRSVDVAKLEKIVGKSAKSSESEKSKTALAGELSSSVTDIVLNDVFHTSENLRSLINAGIFKITDRKSNYLLWTADGRTEGDLRVLLAELNIESVDEFIEVWAEAYTISEVKFSDSAAVKRMITAGIIASDDENKVKNRHRLNVVSLPDAEIRRKLSEAGVTDTSEFWAAWRGDRVVPVAKITNFLPPFDLKGGGLVAVWALVVFLGLQWWAGGEGGGFLAQRLFSCKDEKHSVLAMLWFNLAHFVIRPWPWIVVGIGSLFLIPDVTAYGAHYDQEHAYAIMLMKYLPIGLKGLMVAALMAAYMSTISTHVNFGASYVVNDLYNRFLSSSNDEAKQIRISQIVSVLLAVLAGICAFFMKTIDQGWFLMFELMSGVGFVVLLRWYWWRISAWSELAAMSSSLLMYFLLNKTQCFHVVFSWIDAPVYLLNEYPVRFTINLLFTSVFWIIVTFVTPPEKEAHLIEFYKRVQPAGWWAPIAEKAGNPNHLTIGWLEWACWGLGVSGLFAMIACLGKACLGFYFESFIYSIYSIFATVALFKLIGRMDWSAIEIAEEQT